MANGFQKDITTPISIPEVQVPQGASVSGTGDAIKALSFGLQMINKSQKEKAEQERQAKHSELLGKSQDITAKFLHAMDSKDRGPMSALQQAMFIDKEISEVTTSPTEREFLKTQIAKDRASPLLKAASEAEVSDEDLINEELRSVPVELHTMMGITNVGLMTTDEKITALANYKDWTNPQEIAKASVRKLEQSPNATTFFEAVADVDTLVWKRNSLLFNQLTQEVAKAGSDADKVQLLSQAQQTLKVAISQQVSNVGDMFNKAIASGVKGSDLAMMKAAKDSKIKQLEDFMQSLDKIDDEQFAQVAKATKLIQDQTNLSLQKLVPGLFAFQKVAGSGYSALLTGIMARLPKMKNLTVGVLEGEVSKLLNSPEGKALLAGSFDLKELGLMFEGKRLIEYDSEKADAMAGMRWNMVSELIQSPDTIAKQKPEVLNNTIIAMVEVLDRADEIGDSESLKNANKLLTSDALSVALSKVTNEDTKKTIANYAASSTAKLLENALSNDKGVEYDASLKRFVLSSDLEKQKEAVSKGFGEAGRLHTAKVRLQQANQKLNKTAKILIDNNPSIKSLEEAKDYLLIGADPSRVKGTLTPFKPERLQEIQTIESELAAIREKVELGRRVEDFAEKVEEDQMQLLAGGREEVAPEEDQDKVNALRLKVLRSKYPEFEHLSDEEILAGL